MNPVFESVSGPDLATLIAMTDTDEVVRLRLLREIRDLGHSMNGWPPLARRG